MLISDWSSDVCSSDLDIVLTLARDVDEVAEPVLLYSTVFTDAELAELVLSGSPTRQTLIAGRAQLGPEARGAIASTADRASVLVLEHGRASGWGRVGQYGEI